METGYLSEEISTHTLHAEGDVYLVFYTVVGALFQPTPSMRRVTYDFEYNTEEYAKFQPTPSMRRVTL